TRYRCHRAPPGERTTERGYRADMRLRSRLCACSAALAIALPTTALPALADPSDGDRAGGIEREGQPADEVPSVPDDASALVEDPKVLRVRRARIVPGEDDSEERGSEEAPTEGTSTEGTSTATETGSDGETPTEETSGTTTSTPPETTHTETTTTSEEPTPSDT